MHPVVTILLTTEDVQENLQSHFWRTMMMLLVQLQEAPLFGTAL